MAILSDENNVNKQWSGMLTAADKVQKSAFVQG